MRLFHFTTLTLSVAIAAASSSVFAASLDGGAVAAPDQYSAKVAAQVLKAGGNAVDAAIATAFTLAVTYPEAGNIGGGGFMTLYMDGKPYFLDYREIAPKAASKSMYLNEKGEVIENLSLVGAKAAGVPTLNYGLFINAVIKFLIVAFAVFLMVKNVNRFLKKKAEEPAAPPAPSAQEKLLMEIRDLLAKK